MSVLYGFALVVGVGMFLFSLAADLFGGGDVGVDAGADVDLSMDAGADLSADAGADADSDVHVEHDAAGHHAQASGFRILSIRNATYFLFAFGVTGSLLGWFWGGQRGVLTAALATAMGMAGGAISSLLFGFVRRTESGAMEGDRGWIGLLGHVTLPLSADATGKILVLREGREHELLARPLDAGAPQPERWTRVMVMDMDQGVALVTPGDPLLDEPDVKRIAPKEES
jgi:hypothetical protein